jgi:hypothetical protein
MFCSGMNQYSVGKSVAVRVRVVRIDLVGIVLESAVEQTLWNDFVTVSCCTCARFGRRVPVPRGDWSSVPVGNWSFRVPVWSWSFAGKEEEYYLVEVLPLPD